MEKKSLLILWGLIIWASSNLDSHTPINEIKDNQKIEIFEALQRKSSNDIYFLRNDDIRKGQNHITKKQENLDVMANDLWNCIAESMIKYFNNEIVAYSFTPQEQIVLKNRIAEYFSQNAVFQVKWNKIILNISKEWINKMFHEFLPLFMPKLKWYSKLWIKLLGINTCCNIVYKDIVKYTWKEAETFFLEDVWTLVLYVSNGIKTLYPDADITIWEYLNTTLSALPNQYMTNKYKWYSDSYLNHSISDIKKISPY